MPRNQQLLVILLSIVCALCIIANVYVHFSITYQMPTEPDLHTGRVYSIQVNHGYIRYVTKRELDAANFVFRWVFLAGALCGICALLLNSSDARSTHV